MKIKKEISVLIMITLLMSGICGCGADASAKTTIDASTQTMLDDTPEWLADIRQNTDSDQLLIVANYEGTTAWVSLSEKDDSGKWNTIMTTPGFIGKEGIGKTKEGDGKTPVGTFHFNNAFGIAPDPGCQIPYTQVDDDTYWSGDPRDGMHYNEMVSLSDYPDLDKDNSEHIIDYTRQYQYCLNIDYNKECVPGLGSAIFLHCFGPYKPYTGGCVAIPEEQMLIVMQNVKPDCEIIIDTFDNLENYGNKP